MVKKIAFLFPGQGSQVIGMGKYAFDNSEKAKKLFIEADQILGFPLSQIMFSGPEEKLKETDITQPALFVASAAALTLLQDMNIQASISAGHSLGEYSALYSAGVINFKNTLQLVHNRGKAMQQASVDNPGTMAAIIGLDAEKISSLCTETAKAHGPCVAANFNSGSQTVISGKKEAIDHVLPRLKEAGALKVVPLKVAGAFHSPLMKSAAESMKNLIENTTFNPPTIPVITNVDAKSTSSVSEFKEKLVLQINHPVQWNNTMKELLNHEIDIYIEVGSGRVLSSMIKKVDRKKTVLWTDEFENLKELSYAFKG